MPRHNFVERCCQFASQPFAGHFNNVVDASLARCRFKVQSGAAVQIENITVAIHQYRVKSGLLQQCLFGQLAQW